MPLKKSIYLLLISILLLCATTAYSAQVIVNPGAYQGKWAVDSLSWKYGTQTVDLSVGSHQFFVGYFGYFNIDVASDGTVSTAKTDSATYAGNMLTLLTTTINIDPGAYTGHWWTEANGVAKKGPGPEVLVLGLTYMIISVQLDQSIVGGTFDLLSPCGFNPSILTVGLATFQFSCTVTVHDTTAPVLTVPANITLNATLPLGTSVSYLVSASDIIDPVPTVNCTQPSGSFFQIGTTTVTCTATDASGNSATGSFTVTILNPPPAFYPIGDQTVQEGQPLNFAMSASDPNGNALTYTAMNLPQGAYFYPATGVLSYTPDYNVSTKISNSFFDVFFEVSDGLGGTDIKTVRITVQDVNRSPVLTPIGDRTINEGSLLTFTVSGSDPDVGDILSYSVTELPSGAAFEPDTKTFIYTPGYDISNRLADSFFDVFFTVSDGVFSTTEKVHVMVHNVNRPPVANAGVDLQLQCAGATCPVILDGRSSTDPDSTPGTQDDIATYRWYKGYGTTGQQLLGTGGDAVVTLSLGVQTVTLEVTDKSGAIGTDTVVITLDPAHLSMLVLEKAEIDWARTSGGLTEVKLHGKLALPAGLLLQELAPVTKVTLDLAGRAGVLSNIVNFEVKGGEGEKWEYKASPAGAGTQNFSIHWKGAKFDYKNVIHLKTEFISLTETALAIDKEGTTEAVSLTVNGVSASIDEMGVVTASIPYEIDEDGEVTFTLQFELTPEMNITLTRGTQQPVIIRAGDYYTHGSGNFEWKGKVNPNGLTGASRPATVGMNLTLGNEGFPGSVAVSESQWDRLSTKEWKANLKK